MGKIVRNGVDYTGLNVLTNGVFIDTDNIITSITINEGSIAYSTYEYTATQDCYVAFLLQLSSSSTGTQIFLNNVEIWRDAYVGGIIERGMFIKNGQVLKFTGLQSYAYLSVLGVQQSYAVPSDYSTTEHKTGRKWIDGKDIWEKTYHITTTIGTSDMVVIQSADLPNIDRCISTKGNIDVYTSNSVMSGDNGKYFTAYLLKENNAFAMYASQTFTSYPVSTDAYITLQYTKSS